MLMLLPPHSSGAILPTPSPPSTAPPPLQQRAPATCHLPPCLPHVMICCSHPVLEGASRLGPRSHDAPFLQGFSFAPTRGPGLLRSVIRGFAQDGPRSSRRSSCGSSPRPVTRIVAARQQQKKVEEGGQKKRPQVGHTCSYNATAVALAAATGTLVARRGLFSVSAYAQFSSIWTEGMYHR